MIEIEPIGYVERDAPADLASDEGRLVSCRIVLRPELQDGLMGLEAGQTVLVLFHFNQAEGYDLQLHPRHDPTRPLRGVFATRSQYRPNHIGATVARILSISESTVTVEGLDALSGSPVLDIKPHPSRFDEAVLS